MIATLGLLMSLLFHSGVAPESELSLKDRLGQLLYVNVDGFGDTDRAVHPLYAKLVRDIQPGGILVHTRSRDARVIAQDIKALQEMAAQPLLVGMDYLALEAPVSGAVFEIGLGFGSGVLGEFGHKLEPRCLEKLFYLQAVLHRALGINHALGPTIDKSRRNGFLNREPGQVVTPARSLLKSMKRFGLVTTLKHFPFTPDTYNLHHETRDLGLSREQVQERIEIFRHLAPHADWIMTTHLLNHSIDNDALATFSVKWLAILKRDIGFKGPVISDALLMFRRYPKTMDHMMNRWQAQFPLRKISPTGVFVYRALTAGHDMVILEGNSGQTRRVFDELLRMAEEEPQFAEVIHNRSKRVLDFKQRKMSPPNHQIVPQRSMIEQAVALLLNITRQVNPCDPQGPCRFQDTFLAFVDHVPP